MAHQTLLVCDHTGANPEEPCGPVTESAQFSVGGKSYSADFCVEHAKEYHTWVDYFTAAATVVGAVSGTAKARPAKVSSADRGEPAKIREWAATQGIVVGPRGRIAKEIRDAYYTNAPTAVAS